MDLKWEIGRTPFPVLPGDNDYSGRDFESVFISDSKALSHAFFNGAAFTNTVFANVEMDQIEFGDAQFTDSSFLHANLDGTDFVRANFAAVEFDACDFTDGEWRESIFRDVKFTACKFSHTTVNLCSFYNCSFLNGSTSGLDYNAVNYNVFSRCTFDEGIANEVVLSRNFGMKPAKGSSALILFGEKITLEQICLVSGARPIIAAELIGAVATECTAFRGRMKKLKLEFISNLIRMAAAEQRLAPSSLVYLETMISELAKSAADESDSRAILSAFITIRNTLFERLNAIFAEGSKSTELCAKAKITFVGSHSYSDAENFAQALDEIVAKGEEKVALVSVASGSTLIEIDFSAAVCSVAAVVAAVNLLISQATILVRRSKALKREIVGRKRRPKTAKTENASLIHINPAVLFSGRQPTELISLRKAVHARGEALVRMDEPAEIELIIEPDEKKAIKG
jgi:uncharacterized protein YjbI with pentapeptide repeats